ncbi:MAG: Ferredoxin-type protein NapF [Gammaproteobacteria bacterium]|nr:Ferredoxin-type protein NapF [Gammaproteobacteria bacterium]
MDIHRRNWLRGRFRDNGKPVRLPWLRLPETFNDQCTRCHGCLRSCPEGIIVKNDEDFPTIDFGLGECTFCRRCAEACPENLFATDGAEPPWQLVAFIDRTCLAHIGVTCRCCEDACASAAIRFPPRLGAVSTPKLDVDRCTACGACVSSCPNRAIDIVSAPGTLQRDANEAKTENTRAYSGAPT